MNLITIQSKIRTWFLAEITFFIATGFLMAQQYIYSMLLCLIIAILLAFKVGKLIQMEGRLMERGGIADIIADI